VTRRRETKLTSFGPETPGEAAAPSAAEPPALPVSTLVNLVERAVRDDARFADVWVRGEVSGFRPAGSGHWYFDLKDEGALLHVAMFRADNARVKWQPENGQEVLARGKVGIYAARSDLQLVVKDLRPVGVGPLQLAFEQVRRRLEAEGLFAPERKRPVPRFPARIGLVTSLSGAVLRDVVRTATRRFPAARLLVAGARVQGEGAAESVARGIERLNAHGGVDVIVVARGGGSMEDLWCFNEERVVRAVAASAAPVVSAVGHETDFTLCDFAADLRASTPTAAAETLSPDAGDLLAWTAEQEARLVRALQDLVPDLQQGLDERLERAEAAMRRRVAREGDLLAQRAGRLQSLSPLAVLARGYAVARREGTIVRGVADAPPGSEIEVVLRDGTLTGKVTKVRRDGEEG
jgi:exodeoxyribonuclease VII large subunit